MDNKLRGLGSTSVLRLIAFLALGALSASAFAESAEYRRGYDQGYRDGIEAQGRQQQNGNGEREARIIIEEASYGTRDASCDLRDQLQQMVGRHRSISIAANNELCGDPAPNQVKRLVVRYRCGDAAEVRERAREGDSVTLNCR